MQDKENFGKYITYKRKEKNLTQEELANKLYVIPTTISKWERGITYPDISIISALCKELNISEHEFFNACDDEAKRHNDIELGRYRKVKKTLYYILNISYIIALLACFICNIVIDHKLSWFLVVLVSVFIAYGITSLPKFITNNKYRLFKITLIETLLIYLLLYTINNVFNYNYLYYFFSIASFELIFIWIIVIVHTFINIRKKYKISIALLLLGLSTLLTNQFVKEIVNLTNNSNNISNILSSILLFVIAIFIFLRKEK